MVTGPRQSGKTTLLNRLSESGRRYVSLDDPGDRLFAKTEPSAFLERYSPPVMIDEIQYAPEIRSDEAFWRVGPCGGRQQL
ncbi:MAG: AAA family ATPase [Gracilibacteraceae bacterium]|nr:AAA family ATPase [Gracilibacteraceae bacterium]